MRKTANKQHIFFALWSVTSIPASAWAIPCGQTSPDETCFNAATHVPKSFGFINNGAITLYNAEQETIILDAEVADAQSLEQLLSGISLGTYNVNALTSPLRINTREPNAYFALRPDLASEPVTLTNTPGLYLLPYLSQHLANINAAYFIFTDSNNQLKQRVLSPMPADWDSLSNALKTLNFSNVVLQPNGIINATASTGKIYQALMSYVVVPGKPIANQLSFDTTVGDVNNDALPDVSIIYANGDRQALIVQPDYASAFVLKSSADLANADAYLLATTQPAVIEIDLSANEYNGAELSLANFSPGDKIRFNLMDGIVKPGAETQHSATANQYFSNLNTVNAQRSDAIIHDGSKSVITLMSNEVDIKNATTQSNTLHINLTGGINNKKLLFEFF